jgi:hypothetical protein
MRKLDLYTLSFAAVAGPMSRERKDLKHEDTIGIAEIAQL